MPALYLNYLSPTGLLLEHLQGWNCVPVNAMQPQGNYTLYCNANISTLKHSSIHNIAIAMHISSGT